MKIGAKITAGFLVTILLMAISGGISYYLVSSILAQNDALQDVDLPLQEKTYQIAVNSGLKVAAARGYVITGNNSFLDDFAKLDKEDEGIFAELTGKARTAQGKQMASGGKGAGGMLIKKILFDKVVPLRKEGKIDEVVRVMSSELAPAAATTRKKIDEYIKFRVQADG